MNARNVTFLVLIRLFFLLCVEFHCYHVCYNHVFKNAYKKVCLKVGTVGTNLAFYCIEHSLTLDIENNCFPWTFCV